MTTVVSESAFGNPRTRSRTDRSALADPSVLPAEPLVQSWGPTLTALGPPFETETEPADLWPESGSGEA
jgi:hypothetical protein